MGGIERNDIRHGVHVRPFGPVVQISIEVMLELIEIDDGAPLRPVPGRTLRIAVENGGLGAPGSGEWWEVLRPPAWPPPLPAPTSPRASPRRRAPSGSRKRRRWPD